MRSREGEAPAEPQVGSADNPAQQELRPPDTWILETLRSVARDILPQMVTATLCGNGE
jgi:hypothetical protein